jgi:hypothetical protein
LVRQLLQAMFANFIGYFLVAQIRPPRSPTAFIRASTSLA